MSTPGYPGDPRLPRSGREDSNFQRAASFDDNAQPAHPETVKQACEHLKKQYTLAAEALSKRGTGAENVRLAYEALRLSGQHLQEALLKANWAYKQLGGKS